MRNPKTQIPSKIKVRKHLNADALFSALKRDFDKVPEHRPGDVQISLSDTLMFGFAMFSLKDPTLLAFDERRKKENNNLSSIAHFVVSLSNYGSFYPVRDHVN